MFRFLHSVILYREPSIILVMVTMVTMTWYGFNGISTVWCMYHVLPCKNAKISYWGYFVPSLKSRVEWWWISVVPAWSQSMVIKATKGICKGITHVMRVCFRVLAEQTFSRMADLVVLRILMSLLCDCYQQWSVRVESDGHPTVRRGGGIRGWYAKPFHGDFLLFSGMAY